MKILFTRMLAMAGASILSIGCATRGMSALPIAADEYVRLPAGNARFGRRSRKGEASQRPRRPNRLHMSKRVRRKHRRRAA